MEKLKKKCSLDIFIKKKEVSKNFEYTEDNKKTKDDRFTPVEIAVLHTGLNRNNTYFSKEVVERALNSLSNIPILGKVYTKDKKDFGDHETSFEYNDGEIKIIYNTIPYGVVPKDNNARFVQQYDSYYNEEKDYLIVDGLIWNRMEEAIEILNRDKIKNQSMEIICDYHIDEKNKYEVIDNFEFIGLTFLGDDVEPAMSQANIKKKDYQDISKDENIEIIFSKLFNFAMNKFIKEECIVKKIFSEEINSQENNQVNNEIGNQETNDKNLEENKKEEEIQITQEVENDNIDKEVNEEEKEVNSNDTSQNNTQNTNGDSIKEIENSFLNLLNKANMELQNMQEKYNKLEKEFQEYKQKVESSEKERIIEKFSVYLKDNKEFTEICNKKNEFNIIEFENKCNKIYTEFSLNNSLKKEDENINKSIFFSLNKNNENEDKGKYDDFINKYLNKDI